MAVRISYVRTYVHTYLQSIRTYVRTYLQSIRTYVPTVDTYVRTYVRTYSRYVPTVDTYLQSIRTYSRYVPTVDTYLQSIRTYSQYFLGGNNNCRAPTYFRGPTQRSSSQILCMCIILMLETTLKEIKRESHLLSHLSLLHLLFETQVVLRR